MRLSTFILAICVLATQTRAASIAVQKKIDDLDNVDLDNVAVEPELVDQVTVKDIDNNLRKTADIPVKILEEPILDENSNDYIPNISDNIVVKRIEVDLTNPGLPQRQEHETQNPGTYGEKEKALYSIQKSIDETEKVFKQELKVVSDSFQTLFGKNEDLPAIQQNLQNLKLNFNGQIEKLDKEVKTHFQPSSDKTKQESDENLTIIESGLENIKKNFKNGVDILTEGIEVLTILKEEDEAANVKSLLNEALAKEDTAAASSSSTTQQPSTTTTSSNPFTQFFANFNSIVQTSMSNFGTQVQNLINQQNTNSQQNSTVQGPSNPINNWFSGIQANFFPGQSTGSQSSQTEVTKPVDAQSDTSVSAATSAPTAATTSAPWGPQAFIQGVQNSLQNIFNPGPNQQQQQQQTQQNVQQAANNGPIQQAFQNIVQFIRPGQASTIQQPANPTPAPEKVPEQSSASAEKPDSNVQSDPIPVAAIVQTQAIQPAQVAQQAQPAQPASAPQTAAVNQQQPAQSSPIQQLVQNNPIIKGIQSVAQRIQGTPNPETPRSEEIKNENDENAKIKGNGGQGDSVNSNGIEKKVEEQKEEIKEKKIVEETKPEETIVPAISDKTE